MRHAVRRVPRDLVTILLTALALALLGCSGGQVKGDGTQGGGTQGDSGGDQGGLFSGTEAWEGESKPGTPEEVIGGALLAASDRNEDRGFLAYVALLHPTEKLTQKAVKSVRTYSWKRFRRQAHFYIKPGTEAEFVVTRMVPDKVTAETTQVKYFLDAVHPEIRGKKMPTPVILKRHGAGWLIGANSL